MRMEAKALATPAVPRSEQPVIMMRRPAGRTTAEPGAGTPPGFVPVAGQEAAASHSVTSGSRCGQAELLDLSGGCKDGWNKRYTMH